MQINFKNIKKHFLISLLISISLISLAQNISNKHLIASTAIQADMGDAFAYNFVIKVNNPKDSIQFSKFWVGYRRYMSDTSIIQKYKNYEYYNNIVVHYAYPRVDGENPASPIPEEVLNKKYFPPFKYKGYAMMEYFYNGKKYYYIIKKVKKKKWEWPRWNFMPAPHNIEDPPYIYQRKQQ